MSLEMGVNLKTQLQESQNILREQKEKTIKYYFEHGTNATKTINALGYPSRDLLKSWINEKFPGQQKDCSYRKSLIEYTGEQKDSAVKELLLRKKTVKEIADDIGVDRVTLYNWKNQRLRK